jgi:hypothetical protein
MSLSRCLPNRQQANPLTTPGDYSMSYAYTVTNPDGSISAFTGLVNFVVK